MTSSAIRRSAFVAIVGGLSVAPVGVVMADHHGQPITPNCIGTTFSTAAHALPPGELGRVVREFAQADDGAPGLGNGIQALQSGAVDDEVANNTGND